jgi:hypothetical protein
MGAWEAGNFGNDIALDWVWTLEQSTGLDPVEHAISEVLNCGDDLDADRGCEGLAAAEVVAALRQNPAPDLPEGLSAWVAAQGLTPGDRLVRDCLAALDRIRTDKGSELRELWEEDKEPPLEWYAVLDDLAARLR